MNMENENIIASYPLLSAQEGIFFHILKDSQENKGIYVIQIVMQLSGHLNVPIFWKAWDIVLNRYELLRARVDWENRNKPVLHILSQVQFPKKTINISSLLDSQQEKVFNNTLNADRQEPFDLTRPPYTRLSLFQFSNHAYRLVWSIQHLIFDMAHSGVAVLKEVYFVYNSLVQGEQPKLSAVKPYQNVLNDLNNIINPKAENYWKTLFKEFFESTPLPLAGFQEEQTKRQLFESFIISSDNYKKCQNLIATYQITLNTLIQAAWGLLLKCYTGESDIVFGSVRAYPREIVKNCVGLFLNTLPMRIVFQRKMTILDYLFKIREQQEGVREYVTTSLSKIQEWLGLTTQSSLFKTVVDFKPRSLYSAVTQTDTQHLVKEISFSVDTNYPLVLTMTDHETYLSGEIHYAENLFESHNIQKMVWHFQHIFDQMVDDISSEVNFISMLSSSEQEQQLHAWNQTERIFSQWKPIHQMFENQGLKMPDNIALQFNDQTLTYRELNRKANAVAYQLLQQQITADELVGVYTDRGFLMMVGILGVLKSGAAYLPLDVALPEKRISYILKDSHVRVILAEKNHYSRLKMIVDSDEKLRGVISIEMMETLLENKKEFSNPNIPVSFRQLAYVIYTSGTTGVPKGVLIEHAAAANMALIHQDRLNISENSRVLQFSNPMFDVSVAEWSSALISGATLCILPLNSYYIADVLSTFMQSQKISVVLLSASILQTLPKIPLPYLKTMVVGGECGFPETMDYWSRDRLFLNAYGLTETAVCVALFKWDSQPSSQVIGKPVDNTCLYVLGKNNELLPVGAVGELYVAGTNLARGYLNDEQLTREKFIKNPFDSKMLLFKTGDLVKWLPDGNLVFVGRKDNQIKIRGHRVELDEIASHILQITGVEQCVVLVNKDQFKNKIILAYIKFAVNANLISIQDVKDQLRTKLPSYMIPSIFITVDEMPLTANGKIDKQCLLRRYALEQDHSETDKNILEDFIANIWKRLLHLDQISLEQNVFDFGAYSLLMLEAAIQLSQALSGPVAVIDLFQYPTIRLLSEYLRSKSIELKKQQQAEIIKYDYET